MNPIGTVEPAAVATNVVDAIRRQRAYVFTDDHATAAVEARLQAIAAARDDVLGTSRDDVLNQILGGDGPVLDGIGVAQPGRPVSLEGVPTRCGEGRVAPGVSQRQSAWVPRAGRGIVPG